MKISKSSREGNAYFIQGKVRELLNKTGRSNEWPEVRKRMTSGDYDNLCRVAEEVSYGSIEIVD